MGKPTDRDEVGKSEDGEKTEPPRHGNHPHNGGDEDACRYTAVNIVDGTDTHNVGRQFRERFRYPRLGKSRQPEKEGGDKGAHKIRRKDNRPKAEQLHQILHIRVFHKRKHRGDGIFRKQLEPSQDNHEETRGVTEAGDGFRPERVPHVPVSYTHLTLPTKA